MFVDILISFFAIVAGVAGILGSILPALPGPPLAWVGMLLMFFRGGTNSDNEQMSLATLLIWLAVTIAVTIIDYFVPMYLTKVTGGSKYAGWGATIGLLVGMFFTPIGIIMGTMLGAFVAELIFSHKDLWTSIKSALGAFLGFITGTGAKLICCGLMLWQIIKYI